MPVTLLLFVLVRVTFLEPLKLKVIFVESNF